MMEPITKQLRELMNHKQSHGLPLVELGEFEFRLRCDEIDSVVQGLEAENERLSQSVRQFLTQRDERLAAAESHDGWVELPRDACGEHMHIGDKVESMFRDDGVVTGIQYGTTANGAVTAMVAVRPHGWDVATWYDPKEYHHHHALTVKDVLREFADGIEGQNDEFRELALEDYAKRLALAGEDA